MQTPSASDPSFKAFLDKLKEQNGGGILAQKETAKGIDKTNESLSDLKDETSSVRDSLREGLHDVSDDVIEVQDQLDTANDSLSEIATAIIGSKESINMEMLGALEGIKEAVTGIKLDIDLSELKAAIENVGYDVGKDLDSGGLAATISGIGMNTTKLLDEQLKELSLVRKLTEGSVEYDKEAAQYRNKSGRDVESKVSGKTSKDGGFIDFETARDTLSGQGERAKKENKVKLITGVTTTRSGIKPGDATAKALGANLGSSGPVDTAEPIAKIPEVVPGKSTEVSPEVAPNRNTSIKRARRERGSVTGDVDPKKEEGEELDRSLLGRIKDSAKFFMTDGLSEKNSKEVVKKERETKVSSPRQENPEADNISSTGEIQADAAKSDLELSKQMLDTTREQLTVLKEIKNALSPATPKEITEQKSAPSSTGEKEAVEGGGGKGLMDVASQALDLIPEKGGKPAAGKGLGSKIKGAFKGMSGLAKGTAGLSVAMGAYDAYSNYNEAGEEGQAKLEQINADVEAGKITPKEAEDLKKQTNEATVEKKGEGIGAGAGTAIGGTLGAIAGSVLGPVGTIAGGYLGAKAGEFIGGKVGKLGGQVANYFSGNKDTPVDSAAPKNNIIDSSTDPKEIEKALISTYPAKMQKDINIVNDVREEASIQAKVNSAKTGSDVSKTSTENNDMEREASGKGGANNTVVSNNVSSNNTTKIVPMKASPRPEYTGSSLDRYTNRITVY